MKKAIWDWKANYHHEAADEVFDCMIAEFLLSQGKSVAKQEAVFERYGVTTLDELMKKQLAKFEEHPRLLEYYNTIEMPLIPVLWQMEHTGIVLDKACLQRVGQELDEAIAQLTQELKDEVGFDINLNSSIQVGDFLAEKLRVPLNKTKTGRYATNENENSQHAEQFPFIKKLLQYRELTKLRSTYIDTLIAKVEDDGRVHTTYSQVIASTGRLSSNNPNLQNIPHSAGFGQKIKSCFMAAEGKVLISFDYSQQELRILAHLTGEQALIDAFQANKDIHAATAAEIFKTEFEKVSSVQRRIAKTINFGVIYGMSGFGMSSQLRIPVEDAQNFINTFYQTYPKIRHYQDEYLKQAREKGFVETLLGRQRYVFEYKGQKTIDNAMRRVLINYPIQGSAADLMKKAMIAIHQEVLEENDDCKLLLQIHDDLVFEVKDEQQVIDDVVQKVKHIMCSVYSLSVPIDVDVKIGKKWGEIEKVVE